MSPELSAALCRDFPSLYGDEFCFEIHDGWEPTVRLLSSLLVLSCPDLQVTCCKQKLGTLRVYTQPFTDDTEALIRDAERQAAVTCEYCGDAGSASKIGSWIWVLCEKCLEGGMHLGK